jgi:hypothetical protein
MPRRLAMQTLLNAKRMLWIGRENSIHPEGIQAQQPCSDSVAIGQTDYDFFIPLTESLTDGSQLSA